MKIALLLAVWLIPAGLMAAEDTATTPTASVTNTVPAKIGAAEAASHYNEVLTVTGMVAQVSVRPGIVFINLDHPYPDSPFVAVILGQATNAFPHVKAFKGAQVEITGLLKNFKDRPEIVLTNATQIVVTAPAPTPKSAATGTDTKAPAK